MNEPEYNKIKGVYPFIHPKKITIIEKGVYSKKGAPFIGPSRVYNTDKRKLISAYIGVVVVQENTVVLPKKANILSKFKAAMYLLQGYSVTDRIVNVFPLIKKTSLYYKDSVANYKKYLDDKLDNKKAPHTKSRTTGSRDTV